MIFRRVKAHIAKEDWFAVLFCSEYYTRNIQGGNI